MAQSPQIDQLLRLLDACAPENCRNSKSDTGAIRKARAKIEKSAGGPPLLNDIVDYFLCGSVNIAHLSKDDRGALLALCTPLVRGRKSAEWTHRCASVFPDILPDLIRAGANPASIVSGETLLMGTLSACTSFVDTHGMDWTYRFYRSLIDLGVYPNPKKKGQSDMAKICERIAFDPILASVVDYGLSKNPQDANAVLEMCLSGDQDADYVIAKIALHHGADPNHVPDWQQGKKRPRSIRQIAASEDYHIIEQVLAEHQTELDARAIDKETPTIQTQRARRI